MAAFRWRLAMDDAISTDPLHLSGGIAGAKQRKFSWTASELMETEFPPVSYIIPMIGPEGLMILAGAPKLGKSWLGMDLSISVSTGGYAMGRLKCEEGDVLHLALEDNPRRLKSRLQMMGVEVNNRLTFHIQWPTIDEPEFFDQLDEWKNRATNPKMIVIDTMERIRPSGNTGSKQTAYSADTKFLAPLQAYALEHRLLIVIIHHIKKEKDDDWLKQLSGSLGLSGVADTIAILDRERAKSEGRFRGTGRDIDEFDKVVTFDCTRGLWTLRDVEPDNFETTPERTEILQYLRENGESGTGEIADALKKQKQNISNLLGGLKSEGLVLNPSFGSWNILTHPTDGAM
jgi:hypothetical protein